MGVHRELTNPLQRFNSSSQVTLETPKTPAETPKEVYCYSGSVRYPDSVCQMNPVGHSSPIVGHYVLETPCTVCHSTRRRDTQRPRASASFYTHGSQGPCIEDETISLIEPVPQRVGALFDRTSHLNAWTRVVSKGAHMQGVHQRMHAKLSNGGVKRLRQGVRPRGTYCATHHHVHASPSIVAFFQQDL